MPSPHILQSWEWGEIKQETNRWRPYRYAFYQNKRLIAIASIGSKKVGPFSFMYAPRGPLFSTILDNFKPVLSTLSKIARDHKAVWLKIDPDISLSTSSFKQVDWVANEEGQIIRSSLASAGWKVSQQQIQFPNTQILDLTLSEENLMTNMSANTRRKIRVAERKDVKIRAGSEDDLPRLYVMYSETASRDRFRIRPYEYYRITWKKMLQANMAQIFIASHRDEDIAFCLLFHGGNTCWFFYGASTNKERNRMPNYLLQWESIRWAKSNCYRCYDLWGAPTVFNEDDPLWGVHQFKRGFRGSLIRGLGAWDYTPFPSLYWVFQKIHNLRNR